MTAVPVVPSEHAVRDAIERLSRVEPGPFQVLSCYLKLEPRDKERGKYLIKMKNRVKRVESDLARRALDHAQREATAADLARVLHYFEEPTHLPPARGVALFACGRLALFEALALPHVHRSRLAIAPVPLIRELVALEEEFGTILVAACDRTGARFFQVTAFEVVELPAVAALDASRGGKFHGSGQAIARAGVRLGSSGEHNYHMRMRAEKQRLYAQVADRVFQIHTQRPLAGRVAALLRREERERAWERAHAEAVTEALGSGWAVNGVEQSLKALQHGQVRTLLADGQDDDPRIDDAVEEAFAQRVQVDVVYDERARKVVDGLAGLLRFRR